MNTSKYITYRRDLHSLAELGKTEILTSEYLIEKLKKTNPTNIIKNIGGYGLAAIYGEEKNKTVMLRCELDALPISEKNNIEYKSINEVVSHKCGHDGHMAILLGVADALNELELNGNRIVLLFQPDEETGNGAMSVINNPKFNEIAPDYIYALHNLPSYDKNEILCKPDLFAYGSRGIKIRLKGKTSHAAEPQNAVNPKDAMINISEIIDDLTKLNFEYNEDIYATTIYMQLGSESFGTTPGNAEIMGTLRAQNDTDLDMACFLLEDKVDKLCTRDNLKFSIEWVDIFSTTINEKRCFEIIKQAANENNLKFTEMKTPFKWTEDFGYLTKKTKGAMFGLGAGKDQHPLHNPKYDFPDSIIETGIKMFLSIIKRTMEN